MARTRDLSVKIFADGADLEGIRRLAADAVIKGFTTNPTLMRAAGVVDYLEFSRRTTEVIGDRPLSLEVFSDDLAEMDRQARLLAALGPTVFVKIPITNTLGTSTAEVVQALSRSGIKVNVTALTTVTQVEATVVALEGGAPAYISVFAGRVADTGVDPLPIMEKSLKAITPLPGVELIWASPRELLNIVQADEIGCHIITVTHDLLKKLPLLGKDLTEYSLETVKMFAADAAAAGYRL